MPTYTIKYKNDPESEALSIKAKSHSDAYSEFIIANDYSLKNDEIIIKGGFPMSAETFDEHLEVLQAKAEEKAEGERARETNAQRSRLLLDYANEFKENGFANISFSEIHEILKVVERTLSNNNFNEEEFRLTQMIISDPTAYRFLTLRLNYLSTSQQQAMLEAMNANLSKISKKTSGVKAASLFTGLAAAQHLGEQFADDIGDGDE